MLVKLLKATRMVSIKLLALILTLKKSLVYHRDLTLQGRPGLYRKFLHLIKAVHLHLRILNQKRIAQMNTEYESIQSCPQQPSPPGSQPSTLHVLPKPGEMTLPVYLGKSEAKPYLRDQKTDQYDAFMRVRSSMLN
ncbi:hypothetical protein BASA60_003917 [Batrachochytrium salamandrivorans]|nr:hypothetical protein BASA60_003917 [Batrachochytrium salamandrivorans]